MHEKQSRENIKNSIHIVYLEEQEKGRVLLCVYVKLCVKVKCFPASGSLSLQVKFTVHCVTTQSGRSCWLRTTE